MPCREIAFPVGASTQQLVDRDGTTYDVSSHTITRASADGDIPVLQLFMGDRFTGEILEAGWRKGWDSGMDADQAFVAKVDTTNHQLNLLGEADVAGTVGYGWVNQNNPIVLLDETEITVKTLMPIDDTGSTADRDIGLDFYLIPSQTESDPDGDNYLRITVDVDENGLLLLIRKNVGASTTTLASGYDHTMDGSRGTGNLEACIWRLVFNGKPGTSGATLSVYLKQADTLANAENATENEVDGSPFDISDLSFHVAYPCFRIYSQNTTYYDDASPAVTDSIEVSYPDFTVDWGDPSITDNGSVQLWDGSPDSGGARVYSTDHSFNGHIFIQNSLSRWKIQELTEHGVTNCLYNSSWVESADRLFFYLATSEERLIYPKLLKVEHISPEYVKVKLRWHEDSTNDTDYYVDAYLTLRRGSYVAELELDDVYPEEDVRVYYGGDDLKFTYLGDDKVADFEAMADPSLVLNLPFNKVIGSTTPDVSGYGNDGTLNGDPQIVTGQNGNALEFDGVDDYIEVADAPSLDLTDTFTLHANIYLKSHGSNVEILSKADGSYEPYRLEISSDTISLAIADASDNRDFLTVYHEFGINTWHRITVTFDAGTAKFYKDGVYLGSDTSSITSIYNTTDKLYIGARNPTSNLLDGFIDDVRIYNRVLSEAEIQALDAETSRVLEPAENTVMSDNYATMVSDGATYLRVLAATEKPTAGDTGFDSRGGVAVRDISSGEVDGYRLYVGAVPFSQAQYLFVEAEDATISASARQHLDGDGEDTVTEGQAVWAGTTNCAVDVNNTTGVSVGSKNVKITSSGAGAVVATCTPASPLGKLQKFDDLKLYLHGDPASVTIRLKDGSGGDVSRSQAITGSATQYTIPLPHSTSDLQGWTDNGFDFTDFTTLTVEWTASGSGENVYVDGLHEYIGTTTTRGRGETLSGGEAVVLDAQNESCFASIIAGSDLPKGRYLGIYRVRDTDQVGSDAAMRLKNNNDNSDRNKLNSLQLKTLTSSFSYYVFVFDILQEDVEDVDTIILNIYKKTATENTILVDYFLIIPLGDGHDLPMDLAHNAIYIIEPEQSVEADGLKVRRLTVDENGELGFRNGLRQISKTITVDDDESHTLPRGLSGFGFVQVGDNEEYAWFTFNREADVTLVSNSANVVNTDTDSKFCIVDGGGYVALKNRLGSSKKVKYVVWSE